MFSTVVQPTCWEGVGLEPIRRSPAAECVACGSKSSIAEYASSMCMHVAV